MKITILIASLLLLSGRASAEGVADSSRLSATARRELTSAIAAAREAQPAAFQLVADVVATVPALDKAKRGRLAPVSPLLRPLGRDALLPMLELLAVQGPAQKDFTESAWRALRVGLLEAVGPLADPRAEPVLVALLDGAEADSHVVRAEAQALGYQGSELAVQKLVAHAGVTSPDQLAVISGMGSCRRLAVAKKLGALLDAQPGKELASALIAALGAVGNSWAWQTLPTKLRSQEELPVRNEAARALLAAHLFYAGTLRQAAAKQLVIVDAPATPGLIGAALPQATPEKAQLLEEMKGRLARSPVR